MSETTRVQPERTDRNIVLCADGTGNTYIGRPSNAARIVELLEMDDPDLQIVAYDQGIGTDVTSWKELRSRASVDRQLSRLEVLQGPHESRLPLVTRWNLMRGLATGAGLRDNVQQMYEWLAARHQRENDRVYLFGFSRGAFTVRALAGVIFRCGLSDRRGVFDTAWQLYEPMTPDTATVDAFWREVRPRRCPIHFLGLWDTVKSYGGLRPVMLPHLRHNPIVGTVCHALALDERRGWFDATSWGWGDHDQGVDAPRGSTGFAAARLDDDTKRALANQAINEVWFSGSHSDVGGGNDNAATSDIALAWVVAEAVHAGIRLSDAGMAFLERQSLKAVPRVTDSHTRGWQLLEKVPRPTIDNDGEWPTTVPGVVGPAERKPGRLLRGGVSAVHTSAVTIPMGLAVTPVDTRRDSAVALARARRG